MKKQMKPMGKLKKLPPWLQQAEVDVAKKAAAPVKKKGK